MSRRCCGGGQKAASAREPDLFIPALETSSLIIPVGRWILRTACEAVARWERQGIGPARLAVNLSAIQFRDQELLATVSRTIKETGIRPEMLELEITESVVMSEGPQINRVLDGLHDLGVRICIDDFGTGYSNLRYLAEMPLDTIKVAREFVCEIGRKSASEEVVKTIVNLAHNLGLGLVAEGVETTEQRDFLNSIGCECAQGYLFSRPVIEGDALQLLQTAGDSALSA